MLENKHEDRLIDLVLEQMMKELNGGDSTAIVELLSFIPEDKLIGYLPEDWSAI